MGKVEEKKNWTRIQVGGWRKEMVCALFDQKALWKQRSDQVRRDCSKSSERTWHRTKKADISWQPGSTVRRQEITWDSLENSRQKAKEWHRWEGDKSQQNNIAEKEKIDIFWWEVSKIVRKWDTWSSRVYKHSSMQRRNELMYLSDNYNFNSCNIPG